MCANVERTSVRADLRMTDAQLRELLSRAEGEAVEFKPNLLSRREIAEYAVGIGNAGGGWLIMGVSDRTLLVSYL